MPKLALGAPLFQVKRKVLLSLRNSQHAPTRSGWNKYVKMVYTFVFFLAAYNTVGASGAQSAAAAAPKQQPQPKAQPKQRQRRPQAVPSSPPSVEQKVKDPAQQPRYKNVKISPAAYGFTNDSSLCGINPEAVYGPQSNLPILQHYGRPSHRVSGRDLLEDLKGREGPSALSSFKKYERQKKLFTHLLNGLKGLFGAHSNSLNGAADTRQTNLLTAANTRQTNLLSGLEVLWTKRVLVDLKALETTHNNNLEALQKTLIAASGVKTKAILALFKKTTPEGALKTLGALTGAVAALLIIHHLVKWFLAPAKTIYTRDSIGLSGTLFGPKIPNRAKELQLSAKNRTAVSSYIGKLKKRGSVNNMLLAGPPGTGKTLCANEILRRSNCRYVWLSGATLRALPADEAIAAAEKLLREAKKKGRVLLVVDECEQLFMSRKSGSETTRLLVTAFLNEINTTSGRVGLLMITNSPDELDSAILDRVSPKYNLNLGLLSGAVATRLAAQLARKATKAGHFIKKPKFTAATSGRQVAAVVEDLVDQSVAGVAPHRQVVAKPITSTGSKEPSKSRIPALLALFCILFALFIIYRIAKKRLTKDVLNATAAHGSGPTPTPTPTPTKGGGRGKGKATLKKEWDAAHEAATTAKLAAYEARQNAGGFFLRLLRLFRLSKKEKLMNFRAAHAASRATAARLAFDAKK